MQVSEPSISMHMMIDRFSGFLLTLVERLRVLPENQLTCPSEQTRDVNLLNLQFAEKLYKFVERECFLASVCDSQNADISCQAWRNTVCPSILRPRRTATFGPS